MKLAPFILITLFLLGLTLASAQETQEAPPIHYRTARTIAVWLPYWLDKDGTGAGWQSIRDHAGLIDEVSFFAFAADPKTGELMSEGEGHGMSAPTIVTQVGWLHTRQIAALATITQFNHVGEMLADPARLDLLVKNIVELTETYGFDGVDIDFEDFKKGDPGDAERYTAFLSALAAALHARPDSFGFPRIVVATVLAQTERGAFAFTDYEALANSPIDRIRVMAYDDHYSGSKQAGACARPPGNLSWGFPATPTATRLRAMPT
jgi:spore germination protein YaaH